MTRTGHFISGIGHLLLIFWIITGEAFHAPLEEPELSVAEVSLVSEADLKMLIDEQGFEEEASPPPELASAEVLEQEPPADNTLLENNGVYDAKPLPVDPDTLPSVPLPVLETAKQKAAERVAPVPIEASEVPIEQESVESDVALVEEPDENSPQKDEDAFESALKEAGAILETEANRDKKVTAGGVPPTTPRPRGRPVVTEQETKEIKTALPSVTEKPQNRPADQLDRSIADAVARALDNAHEQSSSPESSAATDLTIGEAEVLKRFAQQCWNVGSLSTEALRVTVVLRVVFDRDAVPEAGSIHLTDFLGGNEAAARLAYEVARRAIIRCGARGLPLPAEKYEQWREVELVFDPNQMRLR